MKFFFDHYDFTSSGAIAALVQGLLAKELWKRGIPRKLSGRGSQPYGCIMPSMKWQKASRDYPKLCVRKHALNPHVPIQESCSMCSRFDKMSSAAAESGSQMGRNVEKQVRWFWRFVMMPLLFGLVGASVNFKKIDPTIIPKSCAIIVAGELAVWAALLISTLLGPCCLKASLHVYSYVFSFHAAQVCVYCTLKQLQAVLPRPEQGSPCRHCSRMTASVFLLLQASVCACQSHSL